MGIDIRDLLKYILAVAAVILVGGFTVYWLGFYKGDPSQFVSGPQGPQGNGGIGASCSILFPAGAGSDTQIGAAIDQWIAQEKSSSPLKGKGIVFAQSGRKANINPAFMVSIAWKESSLGLHIPPGSYNPFGRTASASQPSVNCEGRNWYKFNSWDEAIMSEGEYLTRRYVQKEGATTLGKVMEIYAPRSENDTDTYIKQTANNINEITALASGALGIGCTEGKEEKGQDVGKCLDSREIAKPPNGPPMTDSGGRYAQVTLAGKLEALYGLNKNWAISEACPPTYLKHQSQNHYNGRAVDIVIRNIPVNKENITKLQDDIIKIGFNNVINEYATKSKGWTGGHFHLEWRGN